MSNSPPKKKQCKHCKKMFVPLKPLQVVCDGKCAYQYVKSGQASVDDRKASKLAKWRWRRENATKPELLAKAQSAFNRFIKVQECYQPGELCCISCGKRVTRGKALSSVGWHCGHFLSVGSRVDLRFTEDNAWLQCAQCNKDLSGNSANYRVALVFKIGLPAVLALEGPGDLPNWTHEELRAIAQSYRARARDIEKAAGA